MSDVPTGPEDGPPPFTGAAYLDHGSGQPLHPAAREVLEQTLGRAYADPRRLHRPARESRLLLDNARAVVAECLDVRPDEVTFTPSGTHAVHLGVLGLLAGRVRHGDLLLAGAVEHSAVVHAAQWHARRTGGRTGEIPVDPVGRVRLEPVPRAGVLAVQSANHEVGTLQPLERLVDLVDDVAAGR